MQEDDLRYLASVHGLTVDRGAVGPVSACISRYHYVQPSADGPVCTPGHWRLVKGAEFITPSRRSYGKVYHSERWSRFTG